ncbi:hypothetical protein T492DRAFT_1032110, partial [Pavlovales sp. CCMP2436]
MMVRFLNWANARPAGLAANVERKRPHYWRTEEPEAEAFKGLHLELEASESMQLDEEAGAPTWEDVLARAEFHTPAAARGSGSGRGGQRMAAKATTSRRRRSSSAARRRVRRSRRRSTAAPTSTRAAPSLAPSRPSASKLCCRARCKSRGVAFSPLSAHRWRSRRRSWSASWSAQGRASAVWSPRSATSRSRQWP